MGTAGLPCHCRGKRSKERDRWQSLESQGGIRERRGVETERVGQSPDRITDVIAYVSVSKATRSIHSTEIIILQDAQRPSRVMILFSLRKKKFPEGLKRVRSEALHPAHSPETWFIRIRVLSTYNHSTPYKMTWFLAEHVQIHDELFVFSMSVVFQKKSPRTSPISLAP